MKFCRNIALVLPLLFLATACKEKDVLRIGVALTGEARDGADLGIRGFVGKDAIAEKSLKMITLPDSLIRDRDPVEVATSLAQDLVKDSTVMAVLGHGGPTSTSAAAPIYNQHSVPLVVPGLLGGDGEWVFHLAPRAEEQAAFMVQQAAELWNPRRIAIAYNDNVYGRQLATSFAGQLTARNVQVLLNAAVPERSDSAAVDSLARRIAGMKPEVVVWMGRARELQLLTWPLREVLGDLKIMASDAVESSLLYDNPEGVYVGLVFVRLVDPQVSGDPYNDFQWRYSMWMDRKTTSHAVVAYDAARLVGEALRTGGQTRAGVREYLRSLGKARPAYVGVSGTVQFDDQGWAIKRPMHLAEIAAEGVRPAGLNVNLLPDANGTMPR
jgi:ABC-type branched-subunit amino acid transport system substrate-binding protein